MPRQEIPDPEDFEWKIVDTTYEVIMTDQSPVPEAVVELSVCKCKTSCDENAMKMPKLRCAFVMIVAIEKTIMTILQLTTKQQTMKQIFGSVINLVCKIHRKLEYNFFQFLRVQTSTKT